MGHRTRRLSARVLAAAMALSAIGCGALAVLLNSQGRDAASPRSPMPVSLLPTDARHLAVDVLALLALAVAWAAAECRCLALVLGRGEWRLRAGDFVLALALLLAASLPAPVVLLAAALGLTAAPLVTRRSWRSVEYPHAAEFFAVGLGLVVDAVCRRAGLGAALPAAVAVVVAAVLRHVLAGIAVALTARRHPLRLVSRRLPRVVVEAAATAGVGLLAAWLVTNKPFGLAGLIVPVALLVDTLDQQARRMAEAVLYGELAGEQQRLAGLSDDQTATVIVSVTARVLGGADVELLLAEAEGLVRYRGDETGVRLREPVGAEALDEAWVRALLGGATVRTRGWDGRRGCRFLVGSPSSPRAFVAAARPPGAAGLSRRDVRMARLLARQLTPWLDRAAAGRHPAQDAAAPAASREVELVRAAARRVADAVTSDDETGRLTRLLDEMHGLERAVAALLGATPSDAVPMQRHSAEWTTTGRVSTELAEPVPGPPFGPAVQVVGQPMGEPWEPAT